MDASRILLVGDSLAVGLGPPLRELALAAGLELEVHGQQSTRIDQWAGAPLLRARLDAFQPSLTLVCLGTNDMRQRAARETKRRQIGELVDVVAEGGGDLAWIGPPSMPFPDAGIRTVLREELGARGVALFDSAPLTIERADDGIHATRAGYWLWAEQIAAWVPFSEARAPEAAADAGDGGAPPNAEAIGLVDELPRWAADPSRLPEAASAPGKQDDEEGGGGGLIAAGTLLAFSLGVGLLMARRKPEDPMQKVRALRTP